MKNFNYTSKKIEVSDLSKDHIANAGIIHYKSWFNVKTRNPALLMIVVLVIVSLTSCYGMLRVQDSNHSDRHNGNEGNEGRQGRDSRTHLVSPVMAAAAAIAGHFVDVREFDVAHVE